MAQPERQERSWTMDVSDVHGRPGTLTFRIDGTTAWFTAPSPGTAQMTGPHLSRMIELARQARDELFRREPW